jgi:hypothetical protein
METVEAELERVLQTAQPSLPPRDEPDVDEPDSDESDGPEQMQEPERSGVTALMLDEPDVDGEPPSHEPEAMVSVAQTIEGAELTPLGGPTPSLPKRETRALSAALVLTVGLTLGVARPCAGRRPAPNRSGSTPTPTPVIALRVG